LPFDLQGHWLFTNSSSFSPVEIHKDLSSLDRTLDPNYSFIVSSRFRCILTTNEA
jgi:hypothetical protein